MKTITTTSLLLRLASSQRFVYQRGTSTYIIRNIILKDLKIIPPAYVVYTKNHRDLPENVFPPCLSHRNVYDTKVTAPSFSPSLFLSLLTNRKSYNCVQRTMKTALCAFILQRKISIIVSYTIYVRTPFMVVFKSPRNLVHLFLHK